MKTDMDNARFTSTSLTSCESCVLAELNDDGDQVGCTTRNDPIVVIDDAQTRWQVAGLCQFKRDNDWSFANSEQSIQDKAVRNEIATTFFVTSQEDDRQHFRSLDYLENKMFYINNISN